MRAFLRLIAILFALPLLIGGGACLTFGGVNSGFALLILIFLLLGGALALYAFGVIGGGKDASYIAEDR